MKPGILARQRAAELRAERYEVDDDVRASRSTALALFDLRRRKAEADQRVDAAIDRLQRVDVGALQAELADALAEQEEIARQIAALTAPAGDGVAA